MCSSLAIDVISELEAKITSGEVQLLSAILGGVSSITTPKFACWLGVLRDFFLPLAVVDKYHEK